MGQDVLPANKYARLLGGFDLIALSKKQQQILKNNYNKSSRIIAWGIQPENFPEISDKTIDILGVGSLNSVKNYSLFVEIIAQLSQQYKKIKVEIIGDGNLREDLENEIALKKLDEIIVLTGQLSRKEVLLKMSKAKILLHTSRFESFGMVFLEALYSQMQIVSFEVGIAEASEYWHIGSTKKELLEKLELAMQNKKMPAFKETFTIEKTLSEYCKIYDE